ncbi:MAG: hypothetical protein AB7F28_00425 [Candidatus Margulisiibacteriota bacterium]
MKKLIAVTTSFIDPQRFRDLPTILGQMHLEHARWLADAQRMLATTRQVQITSRPSQRGAMELPLLQSGDDAERGLVRSQTGNATLAYLKVLFAILNKHGANWDETQLDSLQDNQLISVARQASFALIEQTGGRIGYLLTLESKDHHFHSVLPDKLDQRSLRRRLKPAPPDLPENTLPKWLWYYAQQGTPVGKRSVRKEMEATEIPFQLALQAGAFVRVETQNDALAQATSDALFVTTPSKAAPVSTKQDLADKLRSPIQALLDDEIQSSSGTSKTTTSFETVLTSYINTIIDWVNQHQTAGPALMPLSIYYGSEAQLYEFAKKLTCLVIDTTQGEIIKYIKDGDLTFQYLPPQLSGWKLNDSKNTKTLADIQSKANFMAMWMVTLSERTAPDFEKRVMEQDKAPGRFSRAWRWVKSCCGRKPQPELKKPKEPPERIVRADMLQKLFRKMLNSMSIESAASASETDQTSKFPHHRAEERTVGQTVKAALKNPVNALYQLGTIGLRFCIGAGAATFLTLDAMVMKMVSGSVYGHDLGSYCAELWKAVPAIAARKIHLSRSQLDFQRHLLSLVDSTTDQAQVALHLLATTLGFEVSLDNKCVALLRAYCQEHPIPGLSLAHCEQAMLYDGNNLRFWQCIANPNNKADWVKGLDSVFSILAAQQIVVGERILDAAKATKLFNKIKRESSAPVKRRILRRCCEATSRGAVKLYTAGKTVVKGVCLGVPKLAGLGLRKLSGGISRLTQRASDRISHRQSAALEMLPASKWEDQLLDCAKVIGGYNGNYNEANIRDALENLRFIQKGQYQLQETDVRTVVMYLNHKMDKHGLEWLTAQKIKDVLVKRTGIGQQLGYLHEANRLMEPLLRDLNINVQGSQARKAARNFVGSFLKYLLPVVGGNKQGVLIDELAKMLWNSPGLAPHFRQKLIGLLGTLLSSPYWVSSSASDSTGGLASILHQGVGELLAMKEADFEAWVGQQEEARQLYAMLKQNAELGGRSSQEALNQHFFEGSLFSVGGGLTALQQARVVGGLVLLFNFGNAVSASLGDIFGAIASAINYLIISRGLGARIR